MDLDGTKRWPAIVTAHKQDRRRCRGVCQPNPDNNWLYSNGSFGVKAVVNYFVLYVHIRIGAVIYG